MSHLKIFAAAGFAALASFSVARAADMAGFPPPLQSAPVFVQEYQSGWYLRGDVGYRMNDLDSISAVIGPVPTGTTIDDRFTIGGGGGYKSGWFRADVTIDYAWRASVSAVTPDYRMSVDSVTTLANLYLDLGTWYGITPYVGAGAGVAWNRTLDYFSNTLLLPVVSDRKETWEFAWAAMGGLSFNLSPNLLMDISYRYLNMGDAVTPIASNNNQLTVKEMTAQEFRVGLRYNLN